MSTVLSIYSENDRVAQIYHSGFIGLYVELYEAERLIKVVECEEHSENWAEEVAENWCKRILNA
jgi:hypothetical protein